MLHFFVVTGQCFTLLTRRHSSVYISEDAPLSSADSPLVEDTPPGTETVTGLSLKTTGMLTGKTDLVKIELCGHFPRKEMVRFLTILHNIFKLVFTYFLRKIAIF